MALTTGPVWFPAMTPLQTAVSSTPFGYMNTLDMVSQHTRINNLAWEAHQQDSHWNNNGVETHIMANSEEMHQQGKQSQNRHHAQNNDISNYASTGGKSKFNQNFDNMFINSEAGQMYNYFPQKKRKTGQKGSKGSQNYQFSQAHEEWAKQMQKEQKETDDQRNETRDDLRAFILITIPFLFFERPVASYFLTTKLFSILLGKMGVSDYRSLLIMLFLQCVDLKAFFGGRFKLIDGYEYNWYQEIFDTIVPQLQTPDLLRYGLLMLFPQTPAPTYE